MECLRKFLAEVETDEDSDSDIEGNGHEDVLEENFSDHESFSEHYTESEEDGDSGNGRKELKKSASDKSILRVKFIRLQEYLSNLKDYDDNIIALLADSAADEDTLSAEMEGCDKYRDEFHVLTGIMDEKLEKNTGRTGSISADDSVSSVTVKEKRYKLPKIEIKSFDGELTNWLCFWAQFRKIHEDESLEECDKFHYLLHSMLPGTRARELTESYPLTSDNYQKAVFGLER
ncbi:hypothetical protein AVEN_230633-1 [Araneus ventricosus]|uniref:Uncharacterized protein n=1 Tax=Araneus ventricosus TaxID=182803 RepID=A0A4Y2A257_ARAVE|nr:hypothetical protein AVEN_230633-1 [Araneus ventricosus]